MNTYVVTVEYTVTASDKGEAAHKALDGQEDMCEVIDVAEASDG